LRVACAWLQTQPTICLPHLGCNRRLRFSRNQCYQVTGNQRSALCKGHSFSIILEASETQVFHDSPNQSRRRPTQETPPRLSGDRHPPLLAPNFLIASVDRRFRPLTFKFRLRKSFQPRSRCTLASFIRMCSTRRHMSATPQLLHTW
jgi:hypothetical protein